MIGQSDDKKALLESWSARQPDLDEDRYEVELPSGGVLSIVGRPSGEFDRLRDAAIVVVNLWDRCSIDDGFKACTRGYGGGHVITVFITTITTELNDGIYKPSWLITIDEIARFVEASYRVYFVEPEISLGTEDILEYIDGHEV